MKKIAQVLTSLLIVGVMAVSTFAATIGDDGISNTSDTTLNIPKGITVINDGFDRSYSPSVTYTFTIAPSANLSKVKDSNGVSASVKAGPVGGITSEASVVFTPELVSDSGASSLSKELVKNIELEVDLTKFSDTGVYRYTITDTTSADALYQAGIVRGTEFDPTRELDVYVVRNSTTGELEISGYVLLDEIPPIVVDGTKKTPGYVQGGDIIETHTPGQDGVDGTEDDEYTFSVGDMDSVDHYVTVNYKVTKSTEGNMANPTAEYSFTSKIENADGVVYFIGDNEAQLSESDVAQNTFSLADGNSYYLYAVSPVATAKVIELNDTGSTYNAYLTVAGADTDQVTLNSNDTLEASFECTYKAKNTATNMSQAPVNQEIVVHNVINAPSMTGFLMRVLPFAVLGIVAVGGIIIIKKVKFGKEDN